MDIIRKFYDMDLEKVMQIWYDCNCEVHDFIPISYWDRSFGYVSRLIPKSEVYVYEINGVIVGFIGVDEGYIEGLFVHKDYRGLGVGTKLIAYVLQYYDFIELDVFEKNYGAVCFYENRNFQKLRSLPHEDLGEIEYRMCYKKKKEE